MGDRATCARDIFPFISCEFERVSNAHTHTHVEFEIFEHVEIENARCCAAILRFRTCERARTDRFSSTIDIILHAPNSKSYPCLMLAV